MKQHLKLMHKFKSSASKINQHSGSKPSSEPTSDITTTTSNIVCPYEDCEKTFVTQGRANTHFNNCHTKSRRVELADKKYQCDKCPKAFIHNSLLTEHDHVEHQGVRFHCRFAECQTKGQEYRSTSNRSAHERKRHGGNWKASSGAQ